jgi:hypothetical protein
MTFDEMVARVAGRVNQTSTTALARIGENLNIRYRRVMAALGMNVFARQSFVAELEPNTNEQVYDDSNPIVLERIVSLYVQDSADARPRALDQLSFDEMQTEIPTEDVPTKWAIKRVGARSTTFLINSTIPNGQAVIIEGEETTSELSTDMEPSFPEAFHEMLVLGALADEYYKLATGNANALSMARQFDGNAKEPESTPNSFEGMLAQLRLKMALAAHGNIQQGKHSAVPLRPWQLRDSVLIR